jgi:hypothetical protein
VRTLFLAGGGTIVERLEHSDDGARTYSCSIIEGPLAVSDYRATIAVTGEGDNCTIEWSREFEPAGISEQDAVQAVRDAYAVGLDNLRKIFGAA